MFGRRGFQPRLAVHRDAGGRSRSGERELSNVRAYKARLRSVGRGPVPRERSSDSYANVR